MGRTAKDPPAKTFNPDQVFVLQALALCRAVRAHMRSGHCAGPGQADMVTELVATEELCSKVKI